MRGLPSLALGGGAVPSLRLLPGVERRPGGDRHQRRARARPAAPARLHLGHGPGASRRRSGRDADLGRRRWRRRPPSAWPGSRSHDIDVVELYDCYTFTVLVCSRTTASARRAKAAPSSPTAASAPGGSLPVNTGGGQLSSFYMWGMTPVSEAVIQLRGDGGARQVAGRAGGAGERQRRASCRPIRRWCWRTTAREP